MEGIKCKDREDRQFLEKSQQGERKESGREIENADSSLRSRGKVDGRIRQKDRKCRQFSDKLWQGGREELGRKIENADRSLTSHGKADGRKISTMIEKAEHKKTDHKNRGPWMQDMQDIFVVILVLYPLRHFFWGLDLWDTGYSYANFQYMGLEHMDSMWLFSTYLANVVGHFLMKLPFAGSLIGMNLYTGLFISFLALAGYFFCTKKLGIPPVIAFLGEMAAVSLCWCPTAILYNYLTYVLFLGCVILLYKGLAEEKKYCLFAAGLCLGANVLVRFSNLPQAALIVAVWAYGVVEAVDSRRKAKALEKLRESTEEDSERERREEKASKELKEGTGEDSGQERREAKESRELKEGTETDLPQEQGGNGAFGRTVRRTLWCLGGYLTALAILFGYIHIRYGLNAYIEGIRRLFAMTDNATDYKASSMLMGVVNAYRENLYWVVRIGVILVGGMILYAIADVLSERLSFFRRRPQMKAWVIRITKILWEAVCVAILGWLYYRGFCSLEFYSYGSILRPGILFLMLTMLIALIRIFHRNSSKEEKLISGMLILVVLLTSIGSNNGIYPSLNNLFVAAPYTLWQCYRFFRIADVWEVVKGIRLRAFPAKGVAAAFLTMFLVQSVIFGISFVFVESTGAQEVYDVVDNNDVLKGIKMSPERAGWMTSISAYVEENNLQGREVILYGNIPALSYYLQMPSAFNPWSDLASYSIETMRQDMEEAAARMERDEKFRPVIIVEKTYEEYSDEGSTLLTEADTGEESIHVPIQDEKWLMIVEFMEKYGYSRTFSNGKFVVYE